MENKTTKVTFAAIDPYIQDNIVSPAERVLPGRDMVEWGERNAYPDYILGLVNTTPSLRSVILGTTDYITGDDCTIQPLGGNEPGRMNRKGDTIRSQVEALARDYMTYGGFALQVIRGKGGEVVELYHLDIRFLRSNKENSVFYYSEKWGQARCKSIVYPAYQYIKPEKWATFSDEEKARVSSSVLFVKNVTTQVYPFPVYGAAVKACEIERCIDDYHLNSIENGFTSSLIVNFNNGVPTDEVKKEIEKNFNQKFAGHQNAGRIMFSWNPNKDSATTITSPRVENFGERYDALAKHCRQQIFTAFRANPNLFGIPTESLGFSQEEYESAFRLYNRTCVKPVQRIICDAYDKIYNATGVLTIVPFSLEEKAAETNVN